MTTPEVIQNAIIAIALFTSGTIFGVVIGYNIKYRGHDERAAVANRVDNLMENMKG